MFVLLFVACASASVTRLSGSVANFQETVLDDEAVWLVAFTKRNHCCEVDEIDHLKVVKHSEKCDADCKGFEAQFDELAGNLKKIKSGKVVLEDALEFGDGNLFDSLGVKLEGTVCPTHLPIYQLRYRPAKYKIVQTAGGCSGI